MLEKWKQRIIQMNFKKAVLIFVAVGAILVLGFSTALYGNFRGRMEQWESAAKASRTYQEEKGDEHGDRKEIDKENYRKEYLEEHSGKESYKELDRESYKDSDKEYNKESEIDFEQVWEAMHLSTGDIALIAACGIIGIGLAVWYWLLCMVWAYRKSNRMGLNCTVWVLATFFFNLAAIAILYAYALWKGTCTECGRIRTGSSRYCDRCGKSFVKECPDCGQAVDKMANYCSNCGKKLENGDKTE